MSFLTLNQALAMSPVHMAIVMHPKGPELVKLCENGGLRVILTREDGKTQSIDVDPEKHDSVNRSYTLKNISSRPVMDIQEADEMQMGMYKSTKKGEHSYCQIFICDRCQIVGHLPAPEGKDDNLIRKISAIHNERSPRCRQPINWMRIISCRSIGTEEDIPEWAFKPITKAMEEPVRPQKEKVVEKTVKEENPISEVSSNKGGYWKTALEEIEEQVKLKAAYLMPSIIRKKNLPHNCTYITIFSRGDGLYDIVINNPDNKELILREEEINFRLRKNGVDPLVGWTAHEP